MKYTWKTEHGADIILDIEKKIITEERIYDGYETVVPCHKYSYTINSLLVNGVEMKAGAYKQEIGRWPENIHYAFCVRAGKQKAYVAIPDEIEESIYGEERAYNMEKFKKELAVEEEYEKHYNAVVNAMNK